MVAQLSNDSKPTWEDTWGAMPFGVYPMQCFGVWKHSHLLSTLSLERHAISWWLAWKTSLDGFDKCRPA